MGPLVVVVVVVVLLPVLLAVLLRRRSTRDNSRIVAYRPARPSLVPSPCSPSP